MIKNEDVLQFIVDRDFGALATVSPEGKPHVTAVYYYFDSDFCFYFITVKDTKKYVNLLENKNVALDISDKKSLRSVQLEGVAKVLDSAGDKKDVISILSQKVPNGDVDFPPVTKFSDSPFYLVQVKPTWLRYSVFEGISMIGKDDYFVEFEA